MSQVFDFLCSEKKYICSILLSISSVTQKALLYFLDREVILQAEVTAVSPKSSSEPRRTTQTETCYATEREIRVFGESDPDVKEDFLETRDGELRFNWGGRGGDLRDGL